jgi:hypothetical protein
MTVFLVPVVWETTGPRLVSAGRFLGEAVVGIGPRSLVPGRGTHPSLGG